MVAPFQSERFYSLDVLRGVAALSVVVSHWQHFYFRGTERGAFAVEQQPLYEIFFLLYKHGGLAVELFFSLSGFVFFWLYSKAVAESSISARTFVILRFSRLYPLHFATLVGVAIGQFVAREITGEYFVYPYNDTYHFLLNLLFASSWGLEQGNAFNGPIWSVSVEILLYAMFFAYCRLFPKRLVFLLAISIVGLIFLSRIYTPVGQGTGAFFLGGCAYLAYQRIGSNNDPWKVTRWLPCATACAWLVTIVVSKEGLNLDFFSFNAIPYFGRIWPYFLWCAGKIAYFWTAILFPSTILTLALVERENGSLGKRFSWLGEISYSSYLLHFPLQLIVAVAIFRLEIGQSLFQAAWFMALFFLVLVLLSLASYRYFEVPTQRVLRRKYLTAANERIS